MATEEIDGYQRRINGRVVQVKPHDRGNEEATTATLDVPGRPPMAGKPGKFANGRAVPGMFLDLDAPRKAAADLADSTPVVKPKVEDKVDPKLDVDKATQRTKKAVEAMEKVVANKKAAGK